MSLVQPAWVLRSARRYCADPAVRTAAAFATGLGVAQPVHRSQVTRWENGSAGVSFELVRRYEQVCHYPEGTLLTALDLVHRQDRPISSIPQVRRPGRQDTLEAAADLVQAGLGAMPLSGERWDLLSALVGEIPAVLLLPEQWQTLLRRLLQELSLSTGLGYLQRLECAARLAGHASGARHVFDACVRVLTDQESHVYSEAAALLQYCSHPGVPDGLLRLVRGPVNLDALRGALYAVAPMLSSGRLNPEDALEVAQLAFGYCADTGLPYRVRRSAADVLRALKPHARRRLASKLHCEGIGALVASILHEGAPRPAHASRALRKRIQASIEDQLSCSIDGDGQLIRLLEFVTVETNDARRADALQLLMVLPLGPTVGHAYAAELRDALVRADAGGVHEALGVLCFLGTSQEADLLAGLATLATPVPGHVAPIAVEAAWALGNISGDSRALRRAENQIASAVADQSGTTAEVRDGLYKAWAYALGMRGRRDLLAEPGGRGTPPVAWARAAEFWLGLPDRFASAAGTRH